MPSNLRNVRLLAIMAALALVALPAVWGQGLPAPGTFEITGAQVGVDTDSTTWQTILWFIDVSAGAQNAGVVALANPDGSPANVTCTLSDGTFSTYCQWAGNSILTDGALRAVLTGLNPTSTLSPFTIQLLSGGGFAVTAILQHFDAKGNLLSSTALTDPGLLLPAVTSAYAAAIDEEPLVDETIILSNPSPNAAITVTLSAYDGQASEGTRPPIATKQYVLPPLGRVSGLLTAIFPSANFLSYTNSAGPVGLLQGFLSATSSQEFGFAVQRQDFTAGGSIVSTFWSAFPASPSSTNIVSSLSIDPPTSCSGDYTGKITASASVPWFVYVHVGTAKYLPMASGPTVGADGSLSSTTVDWLAAGEVFTLEAQSGGVLQTVVLAQPGSCKGH